MSQELNFTFEEKHVFPPPPNTGENCYIFSVATESQCSAVPYYRHNGVLAAKFPREQVGENPMVRGQERMFRAATLAIHIL
jgi:hypothetical protein